VGASSSGSGNASAWTGDAGSSYNPGTYDANSMYSSYAQMYEQYYMSQGQVVLSTELCCYAVSPVVQLHLSSVE